MAKINLRDYQQDIINQTINSDKSTLIQVPTGGGKTVIAKEIDKYLTNNFNKQVFFVAPKIVLMEQTAEVFRELNPHIIHKNNHYDKKHKILVSTIQTASRRDINPDVLIIKLESVKITNGDYDLQELSKIMCNNKTVLEIVGSTLEYIVNYKKIIVFAVDINHAELLAEAYKKEGFSAKAIHSKLDSKENAQDIEKFKNGQIQILVSVLMLTTGFDVPDVEVAVLARPTKSQNLYKM